MLNTTFVTTNPVEWVDYKSMPMPNVMVVMTQCPEEQFEQMFNCLPPIYYNSSACLCSEAVCGFGDHTIYMAIAKIDSLFYAGLMTRAQYVDRFGRGY